MSGARLLAERVASIPAALRRLGHSPNSPLSLGDGPVRRFVVTGIGSSRAHARFLADRLAEDLGVRAESAPMSSLAALPLRASDEVLVLFSQGLTPSVRPLLASTGSWRRVILVTAASESDGREAVRDSLRDFRRSGGIVRTIPAADEFGTLLRVVGPMLGYLESLRLVAAIAGALGIAAPSPPDVERIVRAVESASAPAVDGLADGLAFVALGRYAELALNLQYKVLEGMVLRWPPVWDLLEFAHGPFQELHERSATIVALAHHGDRTEARLLDRLRGMLVADRHRLVSLDAKLPGALAIFEHEAMLDQLVLRFVGEHAIDPARWPGRGFDGPLYDTEDWISEERRVAAMTRPELERAIAAGRTTAVLPLGSTEQHGAHLPFGTDTAIADALAERFCERVAEAVRLPAVPIGCSSEHLGFAGTVALSEATLAATVREILQPLAASGFRKAFVFSAHGGNFAPLARALPSLREAAAPLQVDAFTDLDALTRTLQREASAHGVSAEASGHHAGETETSIVLALDPKSVRAEAMAAGFVEPTTDPQSLFYPRLADRVPSGVVGDPTAADAARGERYLEAWTAALVTAYRAEKNQT